MFLGIQREIGSGKMSFLLGILVWCTALFIAASACQSQNPRTVPTPSEAPFEALSSTVFPPLECNSTAALLAELNSTVAPSPTLQTYRRSGMSGLAGKLVNIENEQYQLEYLYLARNPTNRTGNVFNDGATLAVGRDKLLESAFQWEFVRVPGEDISLFYLRNKLNELKTLPSMEDDNGRWNYVYVKTVSSHPGGVPHTELVITMQDVVENHYYSPRLYRDAGPSGREIGWAKHPIGLTWIVTFAPAALSSDYQATFPSADLNATAAPLTESTSFFPPPSSLALQAYRCFGLAGLSGRLVNIENKHYKGEFLYLLENLNDGKTSNIIDHGATLAAGGDKLRQSAWQWEFVPVPREGSSVFYLRSKLDEFKPMASTDDEVGVYNYISIEVVSSPEDGLQPMQLVVKMKPILRTQHPVFGDTSHYYPEIPYGATNKNGRNIFMSGYNYPSKEWVITFATCFPACQSPNPGTIRETLVSVATSTLTELTPSEEPLETLSSAVIPPLECNSTQALLAELNSTVAPSPTLQTYRLSGLSGLAGKLVNIENEQYQLEYLYLARIPTNRTGSVLHDGATLSVGQEKLRESAFQWEFVPVPGQDSSLFYLRNKLNELKTFPSMEDDNSRWNYVSIETVSSHPGGVPHTELVITMKNMQDSENTYYHAEIRPNMTDEINGRGVIRYFPILPGYATWIVTLAPEALSSVNQTTTPSPELNATSAPLTKSSSILTRPSSLALLAYRCFGLAGLSGKLVNIENKYYKGEFLYLPVNPDAYKVSCVATNAATLAVGEDKLRQNAWRWEFVPLPSISSSVFYLRNKLDELKPMFAKDDGCGTMNYISIEVVSSPEGGLQPMQLVVKMKPIFEFFAWYYHDVYYCPDTDPREDQNGRLIERSEHRNSPGQEWIVTFAT